MNPHEAKVRELLSLLHLESLLMKSIEPIMEAQLSAVSQGFSLAQFGEEGHMGEVNEVASAIGKKLSAAMSEARKSIIEAIVPVYVKNIDPKDIDEIISFYKTPAGQKYALAAGAMTVEIQEAIGPVLGKIMSSIDFDSIL